jgi:hypothetical protein
MNDGTCPRPIQGGRWHRFSYLVQCGVNEQLSEAATHGATLQVAEQGFPQVRTDTPPTTSWTVPSSRERRVSR